MQVIKRLLNYEDRNEHNQIRAKNTQIVVG